MKRLAVLVVAGVAACTAAPAPGVPDAAQLRPGVFGTGDADAAAANLAATAFADAGRTYGRPAEGARAAAALEYMAGASFASPRWQNVSAATRNELVQARTEVRAAIGVRPGARSQSVVDGLTGAADALDGGNQAGAAAALDRSGAFAAPGTQELDRLGNLPYLRDANLATQHAMDELLQNDTEFRHF